MIRGSILDKVEEVCGSVEDVLNGAFTLDSPKEGAYVVIADSKTGIPMLSFLVGTMDDERAKQCKAFAEEKAARLGSHSEHISSWQSRDINANPKQYGGAIRGNQFIFSCSALKEKLDEAAMLLVAMEVDMVDGAHVEAITAISDNEFFPQLKNAVALPMR